MKVLVALSSVGKDGGALDVLRRRGLEVECNRLGRAYKAEELIEAARGCAGVLAGTEPYTAAVIRALPELRVISRCGAGTDNVDAAAARERGVAVLSTPDGPTQAVAELTVALMLDLIRRVTASTLRVRRGAWEKPMGFLVGELTFGLIGLGRIGKRVASLLRAWDAKVLASDVRPDADWAARNGVELKSGEDVFRESDVVSLHVPYEESLRHFVDAGRLAAMKPGSFLINASRGGLVDEAALRDALAGGRLAGAALDTFETEPYAGPLQGLENAVLTPHIGSYARAGRVRMELEAAENLARGLLGGAP